MPTPEEELSTRARWNHGVITTDDFRAVGLSVETARRWRATKGLQEIHPGVFVHPGVHPSHTTRWFAALVACGEDSMLYGRSAAAAYGLDGVEEGPKIEVATFAGLSLRGVKVHRLQREDRPRTRVRNGLRLPSIERVILDVAACLPPRSVGLAIDDALRRKLTSLDLLWEELNATGGRGRKGTRALRTLLKFRDDRDGKIRSQMEARMLRILRKIPQHVEWVPDFRIVVDGSTFYFDFYFPRHRLAIECHSIRWHLGDEAGKKDIRRDRKIRLKTGIEILYYTWDDIMFAEEEVLREIVEMLKKRELLLKSAP